MRSPSKQFGQRTPVFEKIQEPKSKYILVYEGEVTEVQYFDGLIEYKEEIGIDPLIEVKPLLRSYNEKSISNPAKILDLLITYLKQNTTDEIRVKQFINNITDYLVSEQGIYENSIYTPQTIELELENLFYEELGLNEETVIPEVTEAIEKVASHLRHSIDLSENIDTILTYVIDQQIVYHPKIDKVCLIIDRDPQSFTETQYDNVKKKCEEQEFKLFVSNPCFEFWLLLHSDSILALSREEMLKNKKPRKRAKKRFLEIKLREAFGSYNKNNINFCQLKDKIPLAIRQAKEFCVDLVELKQNLGTNLGLLLEEMIIK